MSCPSLVLPSVPAVLSDSTIGSSLSVAPGLAPIKVLPYRPQWKHRFVEMNKAWIESYFTMEPEDEAALNDVDTNILGKGGTILFAVLQEPVGEFRAGDVVGACGLVPYAYTVPHAHPFEGQRVWTLVKMAVDARVQGQRIGSRLLAGVLAHAKTLGADWAYLETGDILLAANRMYQQAGFSIIPEEHRPTSPYARANRYYWRKL
jgi:putative acetyltransferase